MQKELISEQGFQRFVKEFNNLLKVEKPHWVKEKEIAAAFGDRSENAEYISAKEMIRNIDRRLRFLEKIINNSEVVILSDLSHKKVNFGSRISLLDLNTNEKKDFTVLGTHESNPSKNIISNKSPLGRALLGKEIGEEFALTIADNIYEYEVLEIKKSNIDMD